MKIRILKENTSGDMKKLYKFVVDEYRKAFANGTDKAWGNFYNKLNKKVKELNLGDVDIDTLIDAAMEFHVDESLTEAEGQIMSRKSLAKKLARELNKSRDEVEDMIEKDGVDKVTKFTKNKAEYLGFDKYRVYEESLNEDKTSYGDTTIEDYVNANFSGDADSKKKFVSAMKKKANGKDYFNGLNMSVKDWEKAGQKFGLSMKKHPVTESNSLKEADGEKSYKLRFYKTKKGIDQGNLDHEEFFDTKEEAVRRYKQVFDRKNYALNPTVWVGEGDDWKRLSEIEINESLKEDKTINRYSDVYDDETRKKGWWYFTTHGVQPGSIPKDLNVLEIQDGKNEKGTLGTFVKLDGILNTSELNYYDMKELSPSSKYTNESLNRSKKKLTEDVEKPYFRAFITNLGKYNEGELEGDWVDFPIDEDEFEEKLAEIGIGSKDEFGSPYEEWFVTDYDCNLDAFEWEELGEYPSYETLQEFGELVDSIYDVVAVNNAYEVTGDLREAIEGLNSGDIIFYSGLDSWGDLAYYFMENLYGDEEEFFKNMDPLTFERHFDFEALGRDLGFDTYESEDEDGNEVQLSAGEYFCGDENASDYEIGEAFVEDVGIDGVGNPEYYFDYESYGSDFQYDNFTITSDGIIEYR